MSQWLPAESDRVVGCWRCSGKPALLVGDAVPTEFPLCFWCMAEQRPGAFELFRKELRWLDLQTALDIADAWHRLGLLTLALIYIMNGNCSQSVHLMLADAGMPNAWDPEPRSSTK